MRVLRWLLVVPAALLAPLGAYLAFVTLTFLQGEEPSVWMRLTGSVFLGYFPVVAGAKTAPSNRVLVAAALATIVWLLGALVFYGYWSASLSWTWEEVLGIALMLVASLVAFASLALALDFRELPTRRATFTVVASVAVLGAVLYLAAKSMTAGTQEDKALDTLSRSDLKLWLRTAVEQANGEIAARPFNAESCSKDHGSLCTELYRVSSRNDLGLDRHYRVYHWSLDLEQDEGARAAVGRIVGPNGSNLGFAEDRQALCQPQMVAAMREHGLKIGIYWSTPKGQRITEGVVDLGACLDYLESPLPE